MKRLTDDELLRINEAAHEALYAVRKTRDQHRASAWLVDSGVLDIFDILSMVREIQATRAGNNVEPVSPRKPSGLVHRAMYEQVYEERDTALRELDKIAAAVYNGIGPLEGVGDLEGTALKQVVALVRKHAELIRTVGKSNDCEVLRAVRKLSNAWQKSEDLDVEDMRDDLANVLRGEPLAWMDADT